MIALVRRYVYFSTLLSHLRIRGAHREADLSSTCLGFFDLALNVSHGDNINGFVQPFGIKIPERSEQSIEAFA